ncbi:hypothetical protein AUC43_02025 [Hymenobacter sedentarius]|uniref:Type I restriction enzyme R protein N-terminal domain-containing protein n=1 Tax=Hymenobacter sedentarius TaxID=1411621 RepID=A0A0U4AT98_9BACT|nr:hypothetical protein [Hymenobacter sedentarius]ALW83981.1 hypothetical protein AUC43_02025 [Hymenobacter sedentarius]
MPSASPLPAIYQVIQQVQAQAAANAVLFQNNEAATRAALIDPILRALGWDTSNVRMVEPERMVANKQKLDYLLKDTQGKTCAVVEAKKLGESLDKLGHVGALIGYAFSLKPRKFFITDGLNWHCYSPAHSSYEPVGTLNLRDTPPVEAALQLIQWLDAAYGGHGIHLPQVAASVPLFQQKLPVASRPPILAVQALPKPKKPKANSAGFTPLSELKLNELQPGHKPTQLRLPDGTIKSIATWKEILLEATRYVLANTPHLPLPFSDKAGKTRFLISRTKQPIGSSTPAFYHGNTVYIGTNYSAADCLANATFVMQQLSAPLQISPLAVCL